MILDSSLGEAGQSVDIAPIFNSARLAKPIQFDTEAALVLATKAYVGSLLSESLRVTDEFNCEDGIADLVFYRLRKDWRESSSLRLVSPRWAAALRALPYRRKFSLDWFATVNLASRQKALDTLREYQLAGYCKRLSSNNEWIKERQPRPLVTHVCAVEAKLRDWRRALSQAVRYRAFANQAWVLLDEASIRPALYNLEKFERLNVGLASISIAGSINHYFSPKFSVPTDHWRYWLANSLIARQLQN